MRWILLFVLAWGTVSFAQEDARQLVADRQYPAALQAITGKLALKGAAAKAVNRYELFMLKGECHLQLKVPRLAAEAYASAAKEAERSGTPEERGVAAAHEMLVKGSKAFAYTPRTASDKQKPGPIDILDLASRKRAFAAMLADEMSANDAKVVRAKTAKALPPIAELFRPLDTMEGLERAATGEAARVKALRAELTEAARRAVADALRGIDKSVGVIDKSASTFVEFYQDS